VCGDRGLQRSADLFLAWATSAEQKWVTSGERRSVACNCRLRRLCGATSGALVIRPPTCAPEKRSEVIPMMNERYAVWLTSEGARLFLGLEAPEPHTRFAVVGRGDGEEPAAGVGFWLRVDSVLRLPTGGEPHSVKVHPSARPVRRRPRAARSRQSGSCGWTEGFLSDKRSAA
jgi:hypothetical protein